MLPNGVREKVTDSHVLCIITTHLPAQKSTFTVLNVLTNQMLDTIIHVHSMTVYPKTKLEILNGDNNRPT